ncbi:MAG: phosphatase PAP2 family protein, partial [Phycisphaerales bacterium]|nr:phosphatase PAP2 family protein [Phycisphaerales bacterium]
ARLRTLALLALVLFLLVIVDRWVYLALRPANDLAEAKLEGRDWYQFLRAFGYLPTWAVVAGVLWVGGARTVRDVRTARRRAIAILGSPILAGLIAEVMRVVIARHRPSVANDGGYVFEPFLSHLWSGSGLGMPSSHAAVAFGGAAAIACMKRGTWILLYPCAAGCALTRMLGGDHFATDVFVGMLVGIAVGRLLVRRLGIRDDVPIIEMGGRYG